MRWEGYSARVWEAKMGRVLILLEGYIHLYRLILVVRSSLSQLGIDTNAESQILRTSTHPAPMSTCVPKILPPFSPSSHQEVFQAYPHFSPNQVSSSPGVSRQKGLTSSCLRSHHKGDGKDGGKVLWILCRPKGDLGALTCIDCLGGVCLGCFLRLRRV
jgi:hypothetical protein